MITFIQCFKVLTQVFFPLGPILINKFQVHSDVSVMTSKASLSRTTSITLLVFLSGKYGFLDEEGKSEQSCKAREVSDLMTLLFHSSGIECLQSLEHDEEGVSTFLIKNERQLLDRPSCQDM